MLMSGLQYVSNWKVSAKAIRTQAITECKISCLINHYWLQFIIFDLPTPCLWIDFHFWQVLPIHHFIEYLICLQGGSIWSGWCGSWIKFTPPFDQQLRYLNFPQCQKVLIRFTTLIQTVYYGNIWPIATNKQWWNFSICRWNSIYFKFLLFIFLLIKVLLLKWKLIF